MNAKQSVALSQARLAAIRQRHNDHPAWNADCDEAVLLAELDRREALVQAPEVRELVDRLRANGGCVNAMHGKRTCHELVPHDQAALCIYCAMSKAAELLESLGGNRS